MPQHEASIDVGDHTVAVLLVWSDWGGPVDGTLKSLVVEVGRRQLNVPFFTDTNVQTTVVTSNDVAGLSVHRTIKHIVSLVHELSEQGQHQQQQQQQRQYRNSTAALFVLLPLIGDANFRLSLTSALRAARGDDCDSNAPHNALVDAFHPDSVRSASNRRVLDNPVLIAEMCIGLGTQDGTLPELLRKPSLELLSWIEGADAAFAAIARASRLAGSHGASIENNIRVSTSMPSYNPAGKGPDVAIYVRNVLHEYRTLIHQAYPEFAILQQPPSNGRNRLDHHHPRGGARWECLFLGFAESVTAVPTSPSTDRVGGLRLSQQARRWMCEWCCYPQRMVCFVQCGASMGGERFPLKLVQSYLMKECELGKECALTDEGKVSEVVLQMPTASCFVHLRLDDAESTEGAGQDGAHLSAAPLPLTMSALSAFVTAADISLEHSRLICSSSFAKSAEWLSIMPPCFCCPAESTTKLRVPSQAFLPPSWSSSRLELLLGHRRRGDVLLRAGDFHPSPSDDIRASYACSVECFSRVCDAETAKVARQYVQGNYLKTASAVVTRLGQWCVVASAQCASSDQKHMYSVEVGTRKGLVVYGSCECSENGKQLLCRHSAALCVCLLGVELSNMNDALELAIEAAERSAGDCNEDVVAVATVGEGSSEPSRAALPFTYIPRPLEMSPSGLPSYMVAAAAAEGRRQAAREKRNNCATVRSNLAYLQGPSAPKGRRTTPFFYFSAKNRSRIRVDHPNWSMAEVSKHLGRLWKELPDDEKALIADACKEEGDAWDAAWEVYRGSDEYKSLQEEAMVAQRVSQPASRGRRTERGGTSAVVEEDGIDGAAASETGDAAPLERFHAMNPEWRCDENGQWVCDWDASKSSAALPQVAHPSHGPKLGSLAAGRFADYSASRVSRSHFASRGLSEMETRASLYKSAVLLEMEMADE